MGKAYRSDQVGSLLRPPELLQARTEHDQGHITPEQLRQIEDQAILQALALQRQVGLDVVTDGEYRRTEFRSIFDQAVEGLREDPTPTRPGQGAGAVRPRLVIGDSVRQVRRMTAHESSFLQRHAAAPFKITLPAVSQIVSSYWQRGVSQQAYHSVSAVYPEIVGIVRREIEALIAEGVPYIQLDAPRYTYFVDERWRQRFRDEGEDPDVVIDEWIEADNASLAGIRPEGATIAMHLCRGNNRGGWFGEGSYAPIAEKLFNAIAVERFLLEFDSERAGGFAPLRLIPRDKRVVLGLITTKTGTIEQEDDLLRRIDEASQYFPMANLALSPQCGFATFAEGNPLSWDEQRRKLELVVKTARRAWGEEPERGSC
ncbi:MAG TPA: methionine synthase [Candidatus Tectomicrobia bacterium]|nr:methionine synthase [Candidatus Tectomicrobia bacterium]